MSNQRQVNLRFRLAREQGDQGLDRLDNFEWWIGDLGAHGSCWVCPSAPAEPPLPPWHEQMGWSFGGSDAGDSSTVPLTQWKGTEVGGGDDLFYGDLSTGWRIGFLQMGVGEPTRYWASAKNRAGSYAMNWYLMNASFYRHDPNQPPVAQVRRADSLTESQVQRPTLTPVIADSVWWRVSPTAHDSGPFDLFRGVGGNGGGEMDEVAIPRHGSRPNRLVNPWPQKQLLPGAVNLAFFDGHGETVKLERTKWVSKLKTGHAGSA